MLNDQLIAPLTMLSQQRFLRVVLQHRLYQIYVQFLILSDARIQYYQFELALQNKLLSFQQLNRFFLCTNHAVRRFRYNRCKHTV